MPVGCIIISCIGPTISVHVALLHAQYNYLHFRVNSILPLYRYGEDWKRIRSAINKQVIPRRVSNLTPPLCSVTDDLLNHLEEITSSNGGRVEDVTPIMTKWAFQSMLNTACLLVEYTYITRALKCKPSASDMIIKKPED